MEAWEIEPPKPSAAFEEVMDATYGLAEIVVFDFELLSFGGSLSEAQARVWGAQKQRKTSPSPADLCCTVQQQVRRVDCAAAGIFRAR